MSVPPADPAPGVPEPRPGVPEPQSGVEEPRLRALVLGARERMLSLRALLITELVLALANELFPGRPRTHTGPRIVHAVLVVAIGLAVILAGAVATELIFPSRSRRRGSPSPADG